MQSSTTLISIWCRRNTENSLYAILPNSNLYLDYRGAGGKSIIYAILRHSNIYLVYMGGTRKVPFIPSFTTLIHIYCMGDRGSSLYAILHHSNLYLYVEGSWKFSFLQFSITNFYLTPRRYNYGSNLLAINTDGFFYVILHHSNLYLASENQ